MENAIDNTILGVDEFGSEVSYQSTDIGTDIGTDVGTDVGTDIGASATDADGQKRRYSGENYEDEKKSGDTASVASTVSY